LKRIAVVGSCGAGKSTLSRKLSEITGIKIYHIDKMFWKPGWTPISKEELAQKISEVVLQDSWIIDGNFTGTMDMRFNAADTIIFLDYSLWACLWGVIKRRLMYAGKTRPDMAEGCNEKLDLEFLLWVLSYPFKKRRLIYEKVKKYSDGKQIFIYRNRKQLNGLISRLEGSFNNYNILET
jgi:adenylate kinase family enzyme